uniref:Uncharacterized protein n=1 Tax=Tanacetum cinerariifolium TaxID=118510 RepID=A0A699R715_TANCI|nr:hypothetical protein [Tanacetum cinerariifolium]
MSIYNFLCMPSLDGVAIKEEPHGLNSSLLDRVVVHTIAHALAGAKNAANRKASSEPEESTDETKKTKVGKKGSVAGSSGHTAKGRVEQVDDGTLNDGDQGDDTEFAAEDIESFNDVSQGEHINVIPL